MQARFKRIKNLILFSCKRILFEKKLIYKILVILMLSDVIFVFARGININKPLILVSVEDNSEEALIFLRQITQSDIKENFAFEFADFENAITKLNKNRAFAVIKVEKNSVTNLFKGRDVYIKIYLRDKNTYISKMLTDYIKSLSEVLNTAQNTGLFYMDNLYYKNYSTDERNREFNKMYIQYVSKFMNRDKVFNNSKKIDLFCGVSKETFYYYSFLMVFIAVINIYLDEKIILHSKKIHQRLEFTGYQKKEILISSHTSILLILIIVGILFDSIYFVLNGKFSIEKIMPDILYLAIYIIFIKIISQVLEIIFKNTKSNMPKYAIFTAIFLLSGIIIPRYFLNFFVKNPIHKIHSLFIKRWMV